MEGEAAHHLGRVLRAQTGQLFELSDGQRVWLGRIEKVTRDRVEFSLLEEIPAHQPTLDVTLLLSVVKFDAFEWAIEKATELGAARIVPVLITSISITETAFDQLLNPIQANGVFNLMAQLQTALATNNNAELSRLQLLSEELEQEGEPALQGSA